MRMLAVLVMGLTTVSFVALVVLAYIGAITGDYRVWSVWFVTLVLTLILGAASAFLVGEKP